MSKRKPRFRDTVHPYRTLFLCLQGGTARSGATAYEFSVNVAGHHLIVKSNQTGKWFTLSWQDIIEMAIEAGIDAPDGQATAKERGLKARKP